LHSLPYLSVGDENHRTSSIRRQLTNSLLRHSQTIHPEFRLRPVTELLQHHIERLRATVEWGPLVPYNITGQMNLHPRAAMQFRAGPDKDDFVKFFDQVASDA